MDNNPDLKWYPMLINTETLFKNTTIPLIVTNNSDNILYIPREIIIVHVKRQILTVITSIKLPPVPEYDIEVDETSHTKQLKLIAIPP